MNDIEMIRFLWRQMVHADLQMVTAAETVGDEAYRRERGISLGSVESLLNHCMLAQRTWLERLNGADIAFVDEPPPPRNELPGRWSAVHRELLDFAEAQTPESLTTPVRSRSRGGKLFECPRWLGMLHVADHATYHRGQLNSMIKLAGGSPSNVMLLASGIEQGFGKWGQ